MEERVYNFSAGPAMIAESVLKKAADELVCYPGRGMSVMEMSHRSGMYIEIFDRTKALLKGLMNVPDDYEILFLQGGATLQFSAVPLNLLSTGKADYVDSGNFAHLAAEEAKKYADVHIAASSREDTYTYVPDTFDWRPDADYAYITTNNTIYGTKFHYIPDTGNIPLVADMSSCILSEPMDVSRFGLIYAGAQKNIAPAGLTIVLVREDLIGNARPDTPAMLDYKLMAENNSMYNTPPCFCIYMANLVFDWILSIGGLSEMKRRNERKASLLYDYLDSQSYYTAPVDKKCRSMMNVVFVTGDPELDKKFVEQATAAGLCNLKGHRSVGGMRASIYNAMPYEGVEALVTFMKRFAAENPKFRI